MATPVLRYKLGLPLEDAEAAIRQALQEEGFGVLTEVDVQAVLRQRLGLETQPHRLLGVCNPKIANASLEAEPEVGAFLPCGVSLREGDAGHTFVTIQNPEMISAAFAAEGLSAPAAEAAERLGQAMARAGATRC